VSVLTLGNAVYAGSKNGAGVEISTDNGASWNTANTGLLDLHVSALGENSGTTFGGSYNGGAFVTSDGGTTWSVSGAFTGNGMTINSFASGGINTYAATLGGGVYRSTNGGTSWFTVNNGLSDLNVNAVVVTGGSVFAGTKTGGVFFSANNGAGWISVNTGLTGQNILSLASFAGKLFAGTTSGIYVSTNSGSAWSSSATGFTGTCVSIVTEGGKLFAAGSNGVYVSTNGGGTWAPAQTGLTSLNVAGLLASDENLYAATAGGVFISADSGASWKAINEVMGATPVFGLAADGSFVFAGTATTVWRRPLAEFVHKLPIVQVAPDTIMFNASGVVRTYADSFNIINAGTATLIVRSITSSNNAVTVMFSDSISAGTQSPVTVQYSNTGSSASGTAYLYVTTNDPFHGADTIVVVITVQKAVAVVRKDTLVFNASGTPPKTYSDTLAINNAGNITLLVTGITPSDPAFTTSGVTSLIPGDSGQIVVQYTFTDTSVSEDANLVISTNDSVNANDTIPMRVNVVRTGVRPVSAPLTFSVRAYPDPFSEKTTIDYTLAHSSPVNVKVFNALGVEIATLVNETQTAGAHAAVLNGNALSNGTYFYRFTAGSYTHTGKLTVIH
ncbi:MAG TPA: T9SS type A sorting domain-containing protein, partial [Candidatus Kapabacteria bacterium]|nr:T9SS type A sorting domain-containing protein [Candidatus Kapabacteria bacterium]